MTTDDCDRRKTVIAGLEAAIRDIECPVQFSPLLMEARRMLAAQWPPERWQDIETAPKDGNWVLGYETGINSKFTPHEVMRWHRRMGYGGWFNSADRSVVATHWRPLPDPPIIAEQCEGP
jgi:hypothetical protein